MNKKDAWDKAQVFIGLGQTAATIITAWAALDAVHTTNQMFEKITNLESLTRSIKADLSRRVGNSVANKIKDKKIDAPKLKKEITNALDAESKYMQTGGMQLLGEFYVTEAEANALNEKIRHAKSEDERATLLSEFVDKKLQSKK